MSDVQRAGVNVQPKTGQCDKSVLSTDKSVQSTPVPSASNITAETFNKILMTVNISVVSILCLSLSLSSSLLHA